MTKKIGFIEKNSDVPSKTIQRIELEKYGCDPIHELDDKFDAMQAALLDVRGKDDLLVVYSIAVIGKNWWPKVCLTVAEFKAKGVYSVKTKKTYKFSYKVALKNYEACMEIEDAMKRRVAEMGRNNSGKPKSGPWKHIKQIQALHDDGDSFDKLAHDYEISEATIRRIIKTDAQEYLNQKKKGKKCKS